MKKILVILGGGRPKGNTRQLVDAFIQGATDAGHDAELISLNFTALQKKIPIRRWADMKNTR